LWNRPPSPWAAGFFFGVDDMTLISPVYCTEADMNRYMSAQGIIDAADHDDDNTADTGVVDDTINQATEEIDLFARQRYTQTNLSSSTLINRWATVMACRLLFMRRGNPPPESLELEYHRIADPETGLLVKLSKGLLQLPGVALRDDMRPTMSNLRVDRRYRDSTIRVTSNNSSDAPTALTQDKTIDAAGK
jgi:phage gp36-like protein